MISANATSISFEFFPPKTEQGHAKLAETRLALAALEPEYFSVTYGAGGSTQTRGLIAGCSPAPNANPLDFITFSTFF